MSTPAAPPKGRIRQIFQAYRITKKQDKRIGNRRLRRKVRTAIRVDPEPEVLPHRREATNPWTMGKDGKWRFDPDRHPAFMRK